MNRIPEEERAKEIPPQDEAADLHVDPDLPIAQMNLGAELHAAAADNWRVAKSLLVLRQQVNQKFPGRNKDSDGTIGDASHQTRDSDHNPWVRDGATGVVTAMDITHDPAHGCDAGVLAETIRTSRDARVKYIISNRRIANFQPIGGSPAFAWRPYTGRNPHTQHVHISVKPEKASYDSTDNWPI
jgi:hypothetical protein